jgi:hypothetical protein
MLKATGILSIVEMTLTVLTVGETFEAIEIELALKRSKLRLTKPTAEEHKREEFITHEI